MVFLSNMEIPYFPLFGLGLLTLDFFIFRKSEKLENPTLCFSSMMTPSILMDKGINYLIYKLGHAIYPLELLGVWFIFPLLLSLL